MHRTFSVHVDALEAFAQAVEAMMSDHVHGISTVAHGASDRVSRSVCIARVGDVQSRQKRRMATPPPG